MSGGCGSSLFGSSSQYIKVTGGDFVAIEGANILDRLGVSDLRMPYKQFIKSRAIIKKGGNYLLNQLGDNSTFILIKVSYDGKSVIEKDNYINWNFVDDPYKVYPLAQMMVLTGNSTNRVRQVNLFNPSTKHSVIVDFMIATIDDNLTFFDVSEQRGLSFTGLKEDDLRVTSDSVIFFTDPSYIDPLDDSPKRPLIYISIVDILSISNVDNDPLSPTDTLMLKGKNSQSTIFFKFITPLDAENVRIIIDALIIP